MMRRRPIFIGFILGFGIASSACSSDGKGGSDDDSCTPDDQDGVIGGNNTVKLYVSDTGFSVGTPDSGQANISVQNTSNVMLTISNVGSRPHGFQVACKPTGLPAGCPQTSCFPDAANVPAIAPGASMTATFQTPVVEGEYPFTSAEPGDDSLLGQFVLM